MLLVLLLLQQASSERAAHGEARLLQRPVVARAWWIGLIAPRGEVCRVAEEGVVLSAIDLSSKELGREVHKVSLGTKLAHVRHVRP